jgi:hypothetical protein
LPLGSLNIGLLVCTGNLGGPLLALFSLLRTSEVALNIGAVFLCDFLCLGLTFLLSSGCSSTFGIFLTLALVFYSGKTEVFRSLNKLRVLVSLNLLLAGLLLEHLILGLLVLSYRGDGDLVVGKLNEFTNFLALVVRLEKATVELVSEIERLVLGAKTCLG